VVSGGRGLSDGVRCVVVRKRYVSQRGARVERQAWRVAPPGVGVTERERLLTAEGTRVLA